MINDCFHVWKPSTVTVRAGTVVAVRKVAVSFFDMDSVTSLDVIHEILFT
jgi:hypothetical protein